MILKNMPLVPFFDQLEPNSLYCFGIGEDFEKMLLNYPDVPWHEKLAGLIDNSIECQQLTKQIGCKSYSVLSLSQFLQNKAPRATILITCSFYYDIVMQLNKLKTLDNTECYIYHFMWNLPSGEPISFTKGKDFQIPPVIHYCWFGKKELPDAYKKCIESWYRTCPEYEIKEWNESNCDLESNLYVKQAYEHGKYAFVSDYIHLKVIYEEGGIYLDTDVELINNLDPLRYDTAFCGLQMPGQINLGLGFGACKNHEVIGKMMQRYESLRFVDPDGNLNEKIAPEYQTEDLLRMGMTYGNHQQFVCGMCIYPTEVLCPINIYTLLPESPEITSNTFAIHHFSGSWTSKDHKERKSNVSQRAREIMKLFQ